MISSIAFLKIIILTGIAGCLFMYGIQMFAYFEATHKLSPLIAARFAAFLLGCGLWLIIIHYTLGL